jgi:hypothetical protein
VEGTKCPFGLKNKKEKTGNWFKALDFAVFENYFVECIIWGFMLLGSRIKYIDSRYPRIYWCRRGFMLLGSRIKYIDSRYLRIYWCRRGFMPSNRKN